MSKNKSEVLKLQDTDKVKHVVVKVNQEKQHTTVYSRLSIKDNMITLSSAIPLLYEKLLEQESVSEEEASKFLEDLLLGMLAPRVVNNQQETNGKKQETSKGNNTRRTRPRPDQRGKGGSKAEKNAESQSGDAGRSKPKKEKLQESSEPKKRTERQD